MTEQTPEQPAPPFLPQWREQAFHMRNLALHGTLPAHPEVLKNALILANNMRFMAERQPELFERARRFVVGRQPQDIFELQTYAAGLAEATLEGTDDPNELDLVGIVAETFRWIASWMEQEPEERWPILAARAHKFSYQYLNELIMRFKLPGGLYGEGEVDFAAACRYIYADNDEPMPIDPALIVQVQDAIRNRIIISELALKAQLWQAPDGRTGSSPYAARMTPAELERLNATAATTLEKLHLLKAYGITTFEVPGESLNFPWDIAVMPPLDQDDFGRYADGAVADFMLFEPRVGRQDLQFSTRQSEEITELVIGQGEHPLIRFRLHDNGQISLGLQITNAPNDLAERNFINARSHAAFIRLRGLFIALAFDATVPDDIVAGPYVRGGVGTGMLERPGDPVGKRITELLLRRRKTLTTAGVEPTQRQPKGWPKPPPAMSVRGYIRKLPSGARRRPSAEEEARNYYARHNLAFPGLAEDENWVGPYERSGVEQPYRRARFRNSAYTMQFLGALGVGRRGPRK